MNRGIRRRFSHFHLLIDCTVQYIIELLYSQRQSSSATDLVVQKKQRVYIIKVVLYTIVNVNQHWANIQIRLRIILWIDLLKVTR
jgi:hypothetical protein